MQDETERKAILEFLTGTPADEAIAGRNVWGRVPYRERPGALHVEVASDHPAVVAEAMRSIGAEEMGLNQADRRRVYRARCVEAARRVNRQAVDAGNLKLLMSSNGQLTGGAKAALELLGY